MPRLEGLAEQMDILEDREVLSSMEASISLTGPAGKIASREEKRVKSKTRLIRDVLTELAARQELSPSRNHALRSYAPAYCLEEMMASRLQLPINTPKMPNLRKLTIWMSEPKAKELDGSFHNEGTFLYLIEAHWDAVAVPSQTYVLSGRSSLRWLMSNAEALVNPQPGEKFETPEPRCNDNGPSPSEVFRSMGAIIDKPKKIIALYRSIHVSDDQDFIDKKGVPHRSNDMTGYPLFIAQL